MKNDSPVSNAFKQTWRIFGGSDTRTGIEMARVMFERARSEVRAEQEK